MPDEPFLLPDVLVLSAGGVLGEAWMTGLLAGVEEASGVDFRRVETIVGTSAGSMVGAALAAGRSPRRSPGTTDAVGGGASTPPPERSARSALSGVAAGLVGGAWAASAPLAAPALALNRPAGTRARSWLLARVPASRRRLDGLRDHVRASGARFDGRLRVAAVDRGTGRRVVFGAPGAPPASVADAVAASCAVPWMFAPVGIGGREYVDGGVWSPTNLDAAPAGRDTRVVCLNVAASLARARRSPVAALFATARAAEAVETLVLRRRGAQVRTIGPDPEAAEALGGNLMDERRADEALASGHRQGLGLGAD